MWRVERNEIIDKSRGGERRWAVDFLAKYVRPEKADGCYLESVTGQPTVWNVVTPNDRVEGRDAALSRRVPSHDGLEGNGTGHHE